MKQLLYAFIIAACILIVCRHVVADLHQEERITVLENQIRELKTMTENVDENKDENENKDEDENENKDEDHKPVGKTRPVVIEKNEKRTFDSIKFPLPIVIELNTADSVTLTKVPGIGAKTAATIIRYREQLGGFLSPRQLGERLTWESATAHMDEWCDKWLTADSSLIRKTNVNSADFRQILRHPYISYEQTKALVNYRDKHNSIDDIDVLKMLEEFTDEDIDRLRPYLDFRH